MTSSSDRRNRIPVTIVSGYLGAGKTTLINHVLTNQRAFRVAVLVNDMGEINIDAEQIARENPDEGIIDLSNGCICCRLQGDLLEEATRLADSRDFDYLLVESSGISEPVPVARVFLEGSADSDIDPTERFVLDTMVTVVDAFGFWKEFDAGEQLPPGADEPDRPMSDVLIEGIEFCDLLVLNKCDMVPDDVLDELEAEIRTIQPEATLARTVESTVDPELILGTERFDFEAVSRSPGWKRKLVAGGEEDGGREQPDTSEHEHEHEEEHAGHDHGAEHTDHDQNHGHDHHHDHAADRAGVDSFVFRTRVPFDPTAFADWLSAAWDGTILRAKGVCAVAGTDDVIGVSQAGPSVRAGPIGTWGDDDPETRLVVIGRDFDERQVRSALEDCLYEAGGDPKQAVREQFPLETAKEQRATS